MTQPQHNSEPTSGTIEQLIASARDGDGSALGDLLVVYRKYLVFLARTQVHENLQVKADPSDLAQEVCMAAHGNIAEFRGESAAEFAAWLRGILSNVLATHVRRYLGTQKRDVRVEQSLHQSLNNGLNDASKFLHSQIAADLTSPSGKFARQERFLELASAIESLPDDYRQVIVLRHVEALPFSEVAQQMGRTVNSVEKLWVRALAKLRSSVSE
ncbi:sigma-70 family RNA polymerase sigma factor [Rhodopirellula sp. MGV]|uniref:sigma-70 family RNA polymerase sigma factor n=1 Tax=Rhodopirellula sp. MGV TaxID=2023130 RepID=UPI0018E9E175|nr:sigma-70 family RNA polymerase sigma factor [Rhodopirellula sp. MGV]